MIHDHIGGGKTAERVERYARMSPHTLAILEVKFVIYQTRGPSLWHINGAIPLAPCWASLASWSTVLLISICKSQPTLRFSTCSALWPRLNSVSAGPFASMFEDRPRRQKSQRREIDGCAGQA